MITLLLVAICSGDPVDDIPFLGDDSYEVREEASERLWKALKSEQLQRGSVNHVENILLSNLSHPDSETRMRVKMILFRFASTTSYPNIQKRIWSSLGVKYKQVDHIPWNQYMAYGLTDEQWDGIIKSLPVGELRFP